MQAAFKRVILKSIRSASLGSEKYRLSSSTKIKIWTSKLWMAKNARDQFI